MATTTTRTATTPRISQILPNVKCQSCSASVPLDRLSEHVCIPIPTIPNNLLKRPRNLIPPNITIPARAPAPAAVPASPSVSGGSGNASGGYQYQRNRAPSVRSATTTTTTSSSSDSAAPYRTRSPVGLPSGPRSSLDDGSRPLPSSARRRPSNEYERERERERDVERYQNRFDGPRSAGPSPSKGSRLPPPAPASGFRASPPNAVVAPPRTSTSPRNQTSQVPPRQPPVTTAPAPAASASASELANMNMAGVGRRAFAAAANAVLFTQAQSSPTSQSQASSRSPPRNGYYGPTGATANANANAKASNMYLSTNQSGTNHNGYSLGAPTPPLSPALSSTSSSKSLRSPLSPVPLPETGAGVNIKQRDMDESNPSLFRGAGSSRDLLAHRRAGSGGDIPRGSSDDDREDASSFGKPPPDGSTTLFDKYKNIAASSVSSALTALGSSIAANISGGNHSRSGSRDSGKSRGSHEEGEGEEEGDAGKTLLAYGRDSMSTTTQEEGRIKFPTSSDSSSRSKSRSPPPPQRRGDESSVIRFSRISSASAYSTVSSAARPPSKSTPSAFVGERGRAMGRERERGLETLEEEEGSEPPTPSLAGAGPSLPRRSKTTPPRARELEQTRQAAPSKETHRVRYCVKCDKRISDGRWVRNEGGAGAGVLCEGCWKGMYLPRCRRCDLPIEKGAISSSDGQLKGKWHRGCFTCTVCQDPFPTKEFYVHANNPYCAYHYAALNNSLCSLKSCGEPIEGPCAVAHNGDRFHPEHFICEWKKGGGCRRVLDEYWELDGEWVCEYHARVAGVDNDNNDNNSEYWEEEEEDEGDSVRMRGGDRTDRGTRRRGGGGGGAGGMGMGGDSMLRRGGGTGLAGSTMNSSSASSAAATTTTSRAQKRVTRYISLAGLGPSRQ